MNPIAEISELQALQARGPLVRIPDQVNVPITARIQALIDTAAFRRLARIPQLGLVSLVYPGAVHSRFEHSLGVYRLALQYLTQLQSDPRFLARVSPTEATAFIVAALLHDIGHWPFCHPIEDLRLDDLDPHERVVRDVLLTAPVGDILRGAFAVSPESVLRLLDGEPQTAGEQILSSLLSGPIDVDKMDYLFRDSLHAGVPYGRNFDAARLIQSLCLDHRGERLAITDKGRTAAEMMVFARYIMFSEVYWHHAVRSATAMFQRAFFALRHHFDRGFLARATECEMIGRLREVAQGTDVCELVERLFGAQRRLHKRWLEFSCFNGEAIYRRLARRPYAWTLECSRRLAVLLAGRCGRPPAEGEVLIDTPPVELEVEFRLEVHDPKQGWHRMLGEVSPVVQTLATHQFDDFVKRVRIFVAAEVLEGLRGATTGGSA